ncbi:MAG: putative PLP-dependent aminotransferase [Kiloniellales bacterium]
MPRLWHRTRVEAVEERLRQLYPGGEPVLVSSGRSGLSLIVEYLGLGRLDRVRVFPYASHCVLDAVGRRAMPSLESQPEPAASIEFHQWGYLRNTDEAVDIEDAVDSLCEPGCQLMPQGGRFEVWSLPKILGSLTGGVIWCRDPQDATRLRDMRVARPGAWTQFCLRLLSVRSQAAIEYWSAREPIGGRLPQLALGEIDFLLMNLTDALSARRANFAKLAAFLPPGIHRAEGRWPCVVPVTAEDRALEELQSLGAVGPRHFEGDGRRGDRPLLRVLPLPIHQSVSVDTVESMAEVLQASAFSGADGGR